MRTLEVRRRDGRYAIDEVVERFQRYGVVILREYLPTARREALRTAVERRLEHARASGGLAHVPEYPAADFLLGDILAVRELSEADYLFFRPELLEVARALLRSDQLVYWGDSSIQAGEAARGFHKDNVARSDPAHVDWDGDYGLIRCGFYFQDHDRHSGGLKVRLSSHNIPHHRGGRIADVSTRFGDLVVWSMRLTHSGNNRKLRGLRRIALHPRLEAALPRWLTVPEQARRISAFCAFGRPGAQADAYIRNMRARDADYRPYFQHARRPGEAAEILRGYDLAFAQPHECYGELDAG